MSELFLFFFLVYHFCTFFFREKIIQAKENKKCITFHDKSHIYVYGISHTNSVLEKKKEKNNVLNVRKSSSLRKYVT